MSGQKTPLVTSIYTADPSAHLFEGRIYVYPSHDVEADISFNDRGDQYAMEDYHVLSMDRVGAEVTDHGIALAARDVPWVSKQMWAPDCARGPDGRYHLYFPARNKDDVFQIGVASSASPTGPFIPQPEPIRGSYSIDPCSFTDFQTGRSFLYFGGLWGGQLGAWQGDKFDRTKDRPYEPTEGLALNPRVAMLTEDMLEFDEPVREVVLLDGDGQPIQASDHERRFFEGIWVWEKEGTYYCFYSTGDTHLIVYAKGSSPYGPFEYQGVVLSPPLGWTSHMSVVTHEGRDWLFYHDCSLSKGVDHLRSVKCQEIHWEAGKILPMDP